MATITVGENSYVTEAELQTYADDRDITISGTLSVLLVKAMDWLELQPFKGQKTEEDQDLEWPRENVFINGTEIDDETVPQGIKNVQMAAALIIDSGGDLQPTAEQRVLSKSVDGAVSVTYSDKGPSKPVYTKLTAMLRDYVTGGGGTQFTINRA